MRSFGFSNTVFDSAGSLNFLFNFSNWFRKYRFRLFNQCYRRFSKVGGPLRKTPTFLIRNDLIDDCYYTSVIRGSTILFPRIRYFNRRKSLINRRFLLSSLLSSFHKKKRSDFDSINIFRNSFIKRPLRNKKLELGIFKTSKGVGYSALYFDR